MAKRKLKTKRRQAVPHQVSEGDCFRILRSQEFRGYGKWKERQLPLPSNLLSALKPGSGVELAIEAKNTDQFFDPQQGVFKSGPPIEIVWGQVERAQDGWCEVRLVNRPHTQHPKQHMLFTKHHSLDLGDRVIVTTDYLLDLTAPKGMGPSSSN